MVGARVGSDAAAGQRAVRPAIVVRTAGSDRRLLEDAEAEVAVMPPLETAIPARAIAGAGGEGHHTGADRRLLVPPTIEGDVERLPGRRRRRGEIDAAEDRALIARAVARYAPYRRRYLRLTEDAQKARHGIRGDAGRLEPERPCV